jgi:hypothetical protein
LDDRFSQYADIRNLNLAHITRFHPQRWLARGTNAGGRAGHNDVTGGKALLLLGVMQIEQQLSFRFRAFATLR